MELDEWNKLMDELKRRFDEKNNTIASQKKLIAQLECRVKDLKSENLLLMSELSELKGKWNKFQNMIRKVET